VKKKKAWKQEMFQTQTIIIDGYNFIKNVTSLRGNWAYIQQSKERLSQALFSFNRQRNHSITVVYDGWKNGGMEESYEKIGGIHIIHSRKGETADKVIIRLCEESPDDPRVVTADREIISAVIGNGGQIITPMEFQRKIFPSATPPGSVSNGDVDNDPAYSGPIRKKKKGPSRRPPKAKRKRRALLDSM
jgi:predicted RNA-binding protein with PIN domain